MDYQLSSIIKQEKKLIEDNNENYLELSYDIQVKVEKEPILNDWCVQNVLPTSKPQNAISYDKLKEECSQICIMCYKIFPDSFSLYKHNLTHLIVPLIPHKFFMCGDCSVFCETKNDLQNHIVTTHRPKWQENNIPITKLRHKCQMCGKTYSYKSWFDHMRSVHGQTKFKCEKCGLTFKCKRYLKRHILYIHEGAKPYWRFHKIKTENDTVQCVKCPASFTNKYSLTTHMRNCHSDKKFKCKICKSVLKSKSYLLTHMGRVHYNDGKLHSCNICGKTFKSPRYVRIHVKNSHSSQTKCKENKS